MSSQNTHSLLDRQMNYLQIDYPRVTNSSQKDTEYFGLVYCGLLSDNVIHLKYHTDVGKNFYFHSVIGVVFNSQGESVNIQTYR